MRNYVNHGMEHMLDLHLIFILWSFIFLPVFSYTYLKYIARSKKKVSKIFRTSFSFWLIIFITYIVIRVFYLDIVFYHSYKEIIAYLSFLGLIILVSSYSLFKLNSNDNYSKFVNILNAFFLIGIMVYNFPKSYVNKSVSKSKIHIYEPDQTNFKLLNKGILTIGNACINELIFKNGNNTYGAFKIPIVEIIPDEFVFSIEILDKENRAFTHGHDNICEKIYFRNYKNEFKVLLKQKNPNKEIGWKEPFFTDTITFFKKEERVIQYGRYSNCDCVLY